MGKITKLYSFPLCSIWVCIVLLSSCNKQAKAVSVSDSDAKPLIVTNIIDEGKSTGEQEQRNVTKKQFNKELGVGLIRAVKNSEIEGVKALLEAGANPDTINHFQNREYSGYSALMIALELTEGRVIPMMKLLLENGADPNRREGGIRARSPIHIAAEGWSSAIVQLLVDYG